MPRPLLRDGKTLLLLIGPSQYTVCACHGFMPMEYPRMARWARRLFPRAEYAIARTGGDRAYPGQTPVLVLDRAQFGRLGGLLLEFVALYA